MNEADFWLTLYYVSVFVGVYLIGLLLIRKAGDDEPEDMAHYVGRWDDDD
jgi:hypothetical protein